MYYLKNIYITRNKIIYVLLTLLASGFSSAVSGGRLTGIEDGKGDSDLACSRGDLLRSSTATDGERDRDFVLSSLVVSCIGTPSKVVGMDVWPSWDVCGVGGCSVTVGVEGGVGAASHSVVKVPKKATEEAGCHRPLVFPSYLHSERYCRRPR